MRIFEKITQVVPVAQMPKIAGDAMITFIGSDRRLTDNELKELKEGKEVNGLTQEMWDQIMNGLPTKNGSLLILPKDEKLDFYPLMKGEQFLVGVQGRTYFGGTDEKPFLAEIDSNAIEVFKEAGEEAFYEALKPFQIIELEKEHGKQHTRRQGDFYVYPCFEAADTQSFMEEKSKLFSQINFRWLTDKSAGETRHHFTGHAMTVNKKFGEGEKAVFSKEYELIKGVLNAPDHRPLELLTWHYIFQSPSMHVEIHS